MRYKISLWSRWRLHHTNNTFFLWLPTTQF